MKSRIVRKILLLFLVSFLVLAAVKSVSSATTSTNWAGYSVNSNGVTAISASWIVPAVQCTITGPTDILTQGIQSEKPTSKIMDREESETSATEPTKTRAAVGTQFCLECGNELPLGSKFCNKCGTKQS